MFLYTTTCLIFSVREAAKKNFFFAASLRKAEKKVFSNGRAIKALTPYPSSLMAVGTWMSEKRFKKLFFNSGRPFNAPPPS